MNRLSPLVALCSLLAFGNALASPEESLRIQKTYQLSAQKWTLEMRAATTQDQRNQLWTTRPDPIAFARKMWVEIGPALGQEWTLDPAAWFLTTTQNLVTTNPNGSTTPTFTKEIDAIRQSIQSYHMDSEKLTPVCIALSASRDPRSLAILEKIQASHPNPKIQGVAALGAAMQLRGIGDSPELMQKRLGYLRKAIIQSSDIDFNGVAISKLAEDELYIIRYLTKGRVAPDLIGMDSAGRPLSLSSQKGKVVILIFWSSGDPDAKRLIEITATMTSKFKGKPIAIIGINHDPLEKLRSMQADGSITWQNFSDPDRKLAQEYRVGSWPLAYVLDAERKIHYAGAPGSFVELTADALVADLKK